MTAIPIPIRLAGRPTSGGLVVPYISVEHRDGRATFGAVHASRVDACLRGRGCQTCGQPLEAKVVVFARPRDLARAYVVEPAMHPECAAYSAKVCPMVNGSLARYRSTPRHLAGQPCDLAGCECAGWVSADDQNARSAAEAEPWFAVWLRLRDYRPVKDREGVLLGIALSGFQPLTVRPLNDQARDQEQLLAAMRRAATLLGLPETGAQPR